MVATMTPSSSYSSVEACRLAGVSYRMLDYWTREGLVRPSVPARGSGSARRWSEAEVAILELLGRLSELGIRGDTMREVAEALGRMAVPAGWVIVDPAGRVDVALDEAELLELVVGDRPSLVVLRVA